jgi:RNA polymerase sigma-70 factor (ECF subfamily)
MTQQKAQLVHELLVLGAQRGDSKAFETLVDLWQKPFYSYALKFTGSDSIAWDILQETWLAIIRKLGTLSHPARFKSWAFGILCRKCTDHIRRTSAEKKLKQNYSQHLNGSGSQKQQSDSTLEDEIAKLEPEQRTLLLLRFNQQMSVTEIAQTLHIPEGTVKSRLHRILSQLKTNLSGDIQ